MKLFTSIIQQKDGSWKREPLPSTKYAAKKAAENRATVGIQTQIEPATEKEIALWQERQNGQPA